MKITISGTPGSGKSTIAKLLAQKLNYNYYDVGKIRREVAEKHGMTIQELNKLGEKEDWTDKEADEITKQIGKKHDNFIFVGRLAYHFIPQSIKIYLECDLTVGAKRIMKDDDSSRSVEKYKDVKQAKELLKKRMESDKKRYEMYYKINPYDKSQYDFVIDTTFLTIEQVMQKIMDLIE